MPRLNKNLKSRNGGFTLIELLVVIAIIGILSAIILANLQVARRKAIDAKTLAEFRQVDNALEIYASDHNGFYPYVYRWDNPSYGCIAATDCMIVGVSSNVMVPGLTALKTVTTPVINGSGNINSKGFAFVPTADCDNVKGCAKGEALIMAPTYNGILCQTVGVYEKPFLCTEVPE